MSEWADQFECTEVVLEHATEETAIVSNLGVSSRILGGLEDRERNFYMRGAMGCTTPTGFGLAVANDVPVTVLDGDGSLLMSLGCLSTVGTYDPSNLTIVVWNNETYATTGGQPTASEEVEFEAVAEGCGVKAAHVSDRDAFEEEYVAALEHDGAALVACDVERADPDRPRSHDHHTMATTQRFRRALGAE
jgi:sulfopyruvate decarboxylase subunit beta